MSNLIEKSINLGLGLFAYSREKVEELVEELVQRGEIANKDARQFASELVKRGEEQRSELKKIVKEEVTKALDNFNIAKKEDIVTSDEISKIVREQIKQVLREEGISKE
ncbi:UNVERIFIED_CONTAM: polyhydroxyalkanoate synthesis regulator phasin [Acetivibrio alkalicellulosi]